MTTHATVCRGVVHGKTIELDEETGLSDGQEVKVFVQPVQPGESRLPPGEEIRRAFGGWAEDAEELDAYLEWNHQRRKLSRPEIAP